MNHYLPSRRTLLGGALGASALALAGCSPAASPSPSVPASPGTSPTAGAGEVIGNTEVTVYAWSNGPTIDDNFTKSVDAFNQEFQGKFSAKINFLPYDQYWQKIQLQYSADQPFDIYYWDVQAYAHYKSGLLLDNQAAAAAAGLEDTSKYPTALWDPWRFNGTDLYPIPENIQSVVMFYNKTHFDNAGIPYPDATWTWDKVVEVAGQLQKKDGDKVTQWGLDVGDIGGVWWGLQALSWAAGTAFFDRPLEPTKFQMTDPANVEAFKFIQDLMWDKHVAPQPDERDAVGQAGGFAGGVISMQPSGTWNVTGFQQMTDEWDMAPLPLWHGQSIAPYFLGGWVIPEKSAAITAAQTFATWRATTFQQQMAKDHDWIPISNEARASSDMLSGMPPGFTAAMANIANARIGDLYTDNTQQILNEVFFPTWDQFMRNQITPEEATQKMQDGATALLK